MSVVSTSVKLSGLVFAMAWFGMGPGTILLDEVKATWGKKQNDTDEDVAATVAPPGEIPSPRHLQGHNAYLLEGTSNCSVSMEKHRTETLAQEATQSFVKHPFLPMTNLPVISNTENRTLTVNNITSSSSSPTRKVPWLSFMMRTSAQPDTSKK
jgi:hypothetical protein